jgi:hypothetical protein
MSSPDGVGVATANGRDRRQAHFPASSDTHRFPLGGAAGDVEQAELVSVEEARDPFGQLTVGAGVARLDPVDPVLRVA